MKQDSTIGSTSAQSAGLFWGVDVASSKLDLARYGAAAVLSFENSTEGIERLLSEVRLQPAELIVVEATGGYETALLAALVEAGLAVVRINPRQLRSFATAVGELAKTDTIDARIIARFAHDLRPPVRPLPTKQQTFFADLAGRRRQLVALRTAELNRRRKATHQQLLSSIDAVLTVLDEQIALLDKQLADLIATEERWQQRDDILQSVPGVAAVTSHVLLADLPELGQLDHKPLTKLVGLAPLNRDSGKLRGRRTIFAGRRTVRTALYMAALSAMRFNPSIRRFYQKLRQAGKQFKVAIAACMRKLLTILNALVRNNTPWRNPAMDT